MAGGWGGAGPAPSIRHQEPGTQAGICTIIILPQTIISIDQVELGIADHVWQEKRAAIAGPINALGDRFKPELRTGWL